jgi:hypothetical protein
MNSHVRSLAAVLALAAAGACAETAPATAPVAAADTASVPASATAPAPAAAPALNRNCFLSNQWRNWTTSPEGDALFLRVDSSRVFRVDLTPGTRAIRSGGSFLVNRVSGSNWICTALDLNLTLSDTHGMRRPLIATSLRQLTPEEIRAIPRGFRP